MKALKIVTALLIGVLMACTMSIATGWSPGVSLGIVAACNVGYNVAVYKGYILPMGGVLFVNLGNLEWADGQDNAPGVAPVGYYALKSTIDNFPLFKANPAEMGDHGLIESIVGFTFLSGGFYEVYGTQGKGKVDSESQGESDCQTFLNKYTFIFPGTTKEAKGWCRQMNNSDVVFLAREIDGDVVLIGHKYLRTTFKVTMTSGDAPTSQKGCTVEVSCSHEAPAPIYQGSISLASGSSA
jgi:hypothetical protein